MDERRGYLCFLCDADVVNELPYFESNSYYYLIIMPTQLKSMISIDKFNPSSNPNARINFLYERNIDNACKVIHDGYNWLKTLRIDDNDIYGCTVQDELAVFLQAIHTFGFLKLRVYTRISSSEKLILLSPCEDFVILDILTAIESFNRGDYKFAEIIFAEVQKHSRSLSSREAFKLILALCKFYTAWGGLLYREARGIAKDALEQISHLEKELKAFVNLHGALLENVHFLDNLLIHSKNVTQLSPYILLDLLLNGELQMDQGRFCDAAIRFYRVMEGCVQYQLFNKYGFDTSAPNYHLLKIDETKLMEIMDVKALPRHITFNDGIKILDFLGDEFSKNLDAHVVKNVQAVRNLSILVHGIRTLREKEIQRIREFSYIMLKILFDTYDLDFEKSIAQAKHCSLSADMFLELLAL